MPIYEECDLNLLARRYALAQLYQSLGFDVEPASVNAAETLGRSLTLALLDAEYLEPRPMGDRSPERIITSKAFDNFTEEEWPDDSLLGADPGLLRRLEYTTGQLVKMLRDARTGKAVFYQDNVKYFWIRKVTAPVIDPDDRMLIVKALRLYGNYCDMFGGEQGEFARPRGDRAIALADKIAAGEVVC